MAQKSFALETNQWKCLIYIEHTEKDLIVTPKETLFLLTLDFGQSREEVTLAEGEGIHPGTRTRRSFSLTTSDHGLVGSCEVGIYSYSRNIANERVSVIDFSDPQICLVCTDKINCNNLQSPSLVSRQQRIPSYADKPIISGG
jgi:hypothetical protein